MNTSCHIRYTVTLTHSDGTTASASSKVMVYPDTPAGRLKAEATRAVEDLGRSHSAIMDLLTADEEPLPVTPMQAMGAAIGK